MGEHRRGGAIRAITVAEQPVQANALTLLLATSPDIDVVDSQSYVERARSAILRQRPDVVVIRCSDDHLCRFNRLLDLRLSLPDLGFVVVPGDRMQRIRQRAEVSRAVEVLPTNFSLEQLLAAVTVLGARAEVDHDRAYMSVPIAI